MGTWKLPPETVEEMTQRLAREARAALEAVEIPVPEPEGGTADALPDAVETIAAAQGQAAILRALLEGATVAGARAALFVVRDSGYVGWEGRGFEGDPGLAGSIRGKEIAAGEAAMERVVQTGAPVAAGGPGEPPVPSFGQSGTERALLLPVNVRGKIAGIVYADPSGDGPFDAAALRVLVTAASLAVERLAPVAPRAGRPAPKPSPAPQPASPGAATSSGETPTGPASAEVERREPAPAAQEPPPSDDPAVEDARRFARLLVEEICLYNGEGVEIGRTRKDLATRFADEIDRARAMYEQRISAEVRAKGDFFHEALVRVLAGGDPSALGSLAKQPS
ncbi:MAG: hypothetical protein D6718_09565 [Acidobacteria bacterium]|nr:MAG: hypothetical protein D6718_09565 [Acidobacteriota bacterium]